MKTCSTNCQADLDQDDKDEWALMMEDKWYFEWSDEDWKKKN